MPAHISIDLPSGRLGPCGDELRIDTQVSGQLQALIGIGDVVNDVPPSSGRGPILFQHVVDGVHRSLDEIVDILEKHRALGPRCLAEAVATMTLSA